ncbi:MULTISPECIES: isochorismate synthase [Salimicrobium]|uniref:Isochorismate synthase MenF n=2 Tax=Salimicrobium TaxID=351195 RepID=A0ABY1KWS8_9BACI|nr:MULTISPECIES: isochorismate synthase [Salimicrobium]SDY02877.1 isochorismate synthase [Salimicrobium album]SIS72781.1 isochorismate synthase [Salimicrobium salexigens]
MLQVKTFQTEDKLRNVHEEARMNDEPLLMSITERIDPLDPFSFFEQGKQVDMHRHFWKSAEEDFTLVGIGSAVRISKEGEGRFQETEQELFDWRKSVRQWNPYNKKGTGTVALGGFGFRPESGGEEPWQEFPNSSMTIPEFLLTNDAEGSFLTTNYLVSPEEDVETIICRMEEDKERLQTSDSSGDTETGVRLEKIEEVRPKEWKQSIADATAELKAGTLSKVVLAREVRLTFDSEASITKVLKDLSDMQNSSYVFAFEHGGSYFVGATPERLVKVEDDELFSACLAGTTKRGSSEEEDETLGLALLNDQKNRLEHDYVVQMIRGAVENYSVNVEIPEAPSLYKLRNLQHLYTPVKAKLKEGYSLLDVVKDLHPTPALGGLPQKEAVTYISLHEVMNRGWYASPVGWIDGGRNGEFAVAIRSALIRGDKASLFAGCGVVEDSKPEEEYEETKVKLKPMLAVLGGEE